MKTATTHKLVVTSINNLQPGLHNDGNNLYLQVSQNKTTLKIRRSWIYRYRTNGKTHDMGLGPYPKISLSDARKLSAQASFQLQQGIDPINKRKAQRNQNRDDNPKTRLTLKRTVATYLAAKKSKWTKNQKDKWEDILRLHVYPKYGNTHIHDIDEETVRKILEPIWKIKEPTAKKIRAKLHSILAWAMYMKLIPTKQNPAEWKDALDTHFEPTKTITNMAALPYKDVPDFVKKLRTKTTTTAKALEFLILTASRTNEVLEATWDEINLKEKLWTIKKERMKAKKEHKVPLSERAIQIIKEMEKYTQNVWVFPGSKNNSMDQTIFRYLKTQLGYKNITIHGFRSSFKDWASEETDTPNEVSEQALAHAIPNSTEKAYRRGTLLKKRITLMEEWGNFLK